LKTVEVVIDEKPKLPGRNLPKVMKWLGVNMIRNHSFIAAIKEVIEVSKESDAVRVGIIGETHTGKTTMAEAIAHVIHTESDIHFEVKMFTKKELLDFKNTIANLKPTNHILIFDDVSFLAAITTKKNIDMVQQALTEIRHLEGGRDIKVISILNYHYMKGLPPYLRQSDFKFYTSMGSSEMKNVEETVGTGKMNTVFKFQKLFTHARVRKYYSLRIGPKEKFKYLYKNPFILALFWNNDSLRLIVSPERKFMQKICSTCSGSSEISISVKTFIEEGNTKFDPWTFKAAAKQHFLIAGMNTYGAKMVQAFRYIDRAREMQVIRLDDLAKELHLTIRRTKLQKKLEGVLLENKESKRQIKTAI